MSSKYILFNMAFVKKSHLLWTMHMQGELGTWERDSLPVSLVVPFLWVLYHNYCVADHYWTLDRARDCDKRLLFVTPLGCRRAALVTVLAEIKYQGRSKEEKEDFLWFVAWRCSSLLGRKEWWCDRSCDGSFSVKPLAHISKDKQAEKDGRQSSSIFLFSLVYTNQLRSWHHPC